MMQINDLDTGVFYTPPTGLETFLVWYGEHWFLGTILIWSLVMVLTAPFRFGFKSYRARQRRLCIMEHGWPPEHLDADGNFEEEEEK